MVELVGGILGAVGFVVLLVWFLRRANRVQNPTLPDYPEPLDGATGPKEPAMAKRLPMADVSDELEDADSERRR